MRESRARVCPLAPHPPPSFSPDVGLFLSLLLSFSCPFSATSSVRGLFVHENPDRVSFLAGRPNPESFPFQSLTMHLSPPLGSEEGTKGFDLTIEGNDMVEALS